MNQENKEMQYIEEDTIDLRELWKTLMKRKILIVGLTAIVTILATAYALLVKPVFQVSTNMELAYISGEPAVDLPSLIHKLNVLYEVGEKGTHKELPVISSIDIPKKVKGIINIQAQGYDNISAEKKLEEIIDYIQAWQDKEVDIYISKQKKMLVSIAEELKDKSEMIEEIKKFMSNYQNKILNISKQDAALAGVYTIEIGKKQTELQNSFNQIYNLKNKKSDIEFSISQLKLKKAGQIGKIKVLDYPVKPKKKLIVVVAFITGLFFSVFLVFFLEFIHNSKRNEEE
jgi:uncharacterized protein involved in exopolysaccharide biosynthesis